MAAVEMDLFGQSSAESVGTYHVYGSGGQVDLGSGAAMSRGGKSVLALPSTAKRETVSKI